jgi:hypothetical protein
MHAGPPSGKVLVLVPGTVPYQQLPGGTGTVLVQTVPVPVPGTSK